MAIVGHNEDNAMKMTKYFLQLGCDVRTKDSLPLKMIAQCKGRFELKQLLLDNGADIHAEDDYVFRCACSRSQCQENIKFWLDKGANIHAGTDYGLRIMATQCQYKTMIFLIENGADFKTYADDILRECLYNNIDSIHLRKLLDLGADINSINDVTSSVRNQNIASLRVLAEHGFDFKKLNNCKNNKYDKIFKFLSDQGMNDLAITMILLE